MRRGTISSYIYSPSVWSVIHTSVIQKVNHINYDIGLIWNETSFEYKEMNS